VTKIYGNIWTYLVALAEDWVGWKVAGIFESTVENILIEKIPLVTKDIIN